MAKLIYSAIASLDGYVEDADGHFDWAAPDEEVHAFVNDLERPIGTYLYGRRMYETMVFWETARHRTDQPPVMQDFARDLAGGRQGRLLPDAADGVQRQDADRARVRPRRGSADEGAADRDLRVGGPDLAAQAIEAGLVDEYHLFARARSSWEAASASSPTTSALELELLDERRFRNGTVYLHHRARRAPP